MAVTIQLRRDSETNMNSVTPAVGEMLLATDSHKAVIGDGSGQNFQTMVTNNKFFKYEDGDGGRVFGGNDADETIIIRGNSTQAVPIFKVTTNNTSNSIVEVYDDTQLVKIDATHGAVGDKTLLLKAKASQTGSVIEVQDSGSTDARFKVLEDGQTTIDPNDTTDPSLKVIGSSGSQSNGILRVEDTSNNAVLLVKSDGVQSEQTVTVDGGSIITQANGDATSNVTLVGTTDSAAKAITVDDGGTENFSVTAGGKIDSKDMEISATGRTIQNASVVRADELIGNVLKNIKDISATLDITNSDSVFPVGGVRPWCAGNTNAGSLPDAFINMSQLGVEGNPNVSLRDAPTGKYFVLGIGLSNISNDDHTFVSPQVAIVDHETGENESVFTVNANRSAFGFVVRIT